MKKPEELEHGDLVEVDSPQKFESLNTRLDEDLTYFIAAAELREEEPGASRLAVAIISADEDLSYSEVTEAYAVKAMDKFDWVQQDQEVEEE